MAKKKAVIESVTTTGELPKEIVTGAPIEVITDTFGNGELNILKDKINEIIKTVNTK